VAIRSARRYALLKAWDAKRRGEEGLKHTWLAVQRGHAGTPLPLDVPGLTKLLAAYYQATEDVDGADEQELITNARLTRTEARKALAAL
jgi:hypothetical protein